MSKPNKHTIYAAAVAVLFIAAAFLRSLGRSITTSNGKFVIGVLRGLIYICLFSTWGVSLRRRIIQTQVRRFLTAISALMVFWVAVRALKFMLLPDMHITRYLWYFYYIPMLFIPVIALCIALSLGESEKYQLPHWAYTLFGVSAILLIFVLTNDFHQLVFGFPNGLLHFENDEYTHRFGYYLIIGWIALCVITAFAFIAVKCRVPYSKRRIYLPCIPLVLLVIYAALYLTALDAIHSFAGDMTIVICLLTAAAFESCIQCGLIQSNTHYNELFECSGIRAKISDEDYNILLSSTDREAFSKDFMRQTKNGAVMLDHGLRLCGAPIKMGHILWLEDVSEMTEVISELADNSEYLTTRRILLHEEVEMQKKEQRLIEQNRLYNHLMNDNQEKYMLFDNLISQLEAANDAGQEKKLTAKIAVVCTHIKRRGNLFFLAENGEVIHALEVHFALEEWLTSLRLCGVTCNLYFNMKSTMTFSQIIAMYDTFQSVLLYTLDTLHSLLVTADEKNGEPCLLLNLSCDCDLSAISYPDVSISDEEDGEWIVTIRIPKGGASV